MTPRRRRSDRAPGDLPTPDEDRQDYWVEMGARLHELVRSAVESSGEKQGGGLAADVKANPSQFSEALKPQGVKRFAIEWLPRVIFTPKGIEILRFLDRILKMEPKPLPVANPEEKLRRLVARIESKGSMGRELLREEFGEEVDAIVRAACGDAA